MPEPHPSRFALLLPVKGRERAKSRLDLPDPNPFIVFWTYSHPPTASRMRFAAEYDAWAPGSRGPKFVK